MSGDHSETVNVESTVNVPTTTEECASSTEALVSNSTKSSPSSPQKSIIDDPSVLLSSGEDEDEDVNIVLDPVTLSKATIQLGSVNNNNQQSATNNRVTIPPNRISQSYTNHHVNSNHQPFSVRAGMAIPTSLDSTPNPNMFRGQQANIMSILQSGMKPYELEMDPDSFEDKPWLRPNEKLSDYFNYGFNPESWKLYLIRQRKFREENGAVTLSGKPLPRNNPVVNSATNNNNVPSDWIATDEDRHNRTRMGNEDDHANTTIEGGIGPSVSKVMVQTEVDRRRSSNREGSSRSRDRKRPNDDRRDDRLEKGNETRDSLHLVDRGGGERERYERERSERFKREKMERERERDERDRNERLRREERSDRHGNHRSRISRREDKGEYGGGATRSKRNRSRDRIHGDDLDRKRMRAQ